MLPFCTVPACIWANEDANWVLDVGARRSWRYLVTCSHQATKTKNLTETIPCSMHGVPERRSNERGGWCGVTPCVVSSPHRLPTKCATFTPKYDRLLAARGCRGERHGWPSQRGCVFLSFKSLVLTCRRWYFRILSYFSANILTTKQHVTKKKNQICFLNFGNLSKIKATNENTTTISTWVTDQRWSRVILMVSWRLKHLPWHPRIDYSCFATYHAPLCLPSLPVCISPVSIK